MKKRTDETTAKPTKIEKKIKALGHIQFEEIAELYRLIEFGRLASGIFHDLGNPLTSLALSIRKLEELKVAKIPGVSPYLAMTVAAYKRLERFTNTIQKQLTSQSVLETFSVKKEIKDAIDLLRHKAAKTKTSMTYKGAPLLTYGNPTKFHQIAVNLISNALDACGENEQEKKRVVTIALFEQDNVIHFLVHDNGIGIAGEIAGKIFDPFFTTKGAIKGTGLGLSVVQRIIEKDFAGTIRFKSTPNKGTTFTVTFPKRKPPAVKK